MERRLFLRSGLALAVAGGLALSGEISPAFAKVQPPLLSGPQSGYSWIKIIDMDWQPIDSRPITPPVPYVKLSCPPGQAPPSPPYFGTSSGISVGALYRVTPSSNLTQESGTSNYFDRAWSFSTPYEYRRDFLSWAVVQNPVTLQYTLYTATGYYYVPATYKKIIVSENQVADSRLDMRFSDTHYQDFNFKDGAYRGGLYAGNNSDGAKVGRSYLKFGVNSGDVLWPVGYLYAFKTRFARTGTASIKVRTTPPSWSKQSLVWTNAPVPQAEGYPAKYVEWNSTTPVSEWNRFRAAKDIEAAPGNVLSLSLLSDLESSAPWAYFARQEWKDRDESAPIHPPYLLYAVGGQGAGAYTDPDPSGGDNGGGGNGNGTGTGDGGGVSTPPGGGGTPPGGGGVQTGSAPKKPVKKGTK